MKDCKHENFKAEVKVGRLSQVEGGPVTHYCADVTVCCAECGLPFQFSGLPLGMSAYTATMSMDGLELRAPLMPMGEKTPEGLPGFSVRIGDTQQ